MGLFAEIPEEMQLVVDSDHRSSPPSHHQHRVHQIWPKQISALLQTTGIKPNSLHLHLKTTPARPPRHLRPAKPPGKARVRPGRRWSTNRRGRWKKRGEGGGGKRTLQTSPWVEIFLSRLVKMFPCSSIIYGLL